METHHDGQVIRIFDLRHLVGNRVETVGAEDIVDTQRIEEAAESMRIARTALAESVVQPPGHRAVNIGHRRIVEIAADDAPRTRVGDDHSSYKEFEERLLSTVF